MAENTQEDVARQDAGKPGGSFGSPLVSLWRDFRECVDAGRVLGACLLCAWLVLLACTRLPYNESNGVDMGGVRLLPLIIYLVALAAAVLVRVLFALPSFKFRAQGRTLFSMLSRLLLTAGCYELLEDRADADVPVRLGVAVGLMAAGFAGMLVSSAGHGPVPLRRCGVSIFTGVLGGTALGLAVLLLPRWIGNMAFVFLPLASGIAGLATSGRGVLGENGRVGYGERAAEGARGGSGVLRSGLVSNDPALARVKHSILRPLLVCGFLFSLALQTLCVDEAYAFAAFGTNEGVLGLVLLLVLFGCCTVVILTNVSGESLSVAFKPVGALFLLCFFLRIAFGAAESALSSALASAAVCCMVTCACVGFTTLGKR